MRQLTASQTAAEVDWPVNLRQQMYAAEFD
jgi:hypothetical protein